MTDALLARLERHLGKPLGASEPVETPDEVNLPMIRHWVDALDDRNPAYLDEEVAARGRFGGIVAPPAMLQVWTMARPRIEGIAERGGAPMQMDADSPIRILDGAGFPGTLATNSELEFERYLSPGDLVHASTVLESVSDRKVTALGEGYFVTWVTRYVDRRGEPVGLQRFRILKFKPGPPPARSAASANTRAEAESSGEELPAFELPLTATVIVAGAIASRDFNPAHHDRDFARAQGAPDIFMNIFTTNGYVSRFVTDWAGPEAMLRRIAIRLGAPAIPGKVLRFTGQVASEHEEGGLRVVEVAVRAASELGPHATGSVRLTLPGA